METPDLLNETDHSSESSGFSNFLTTSSLMDVALSFDRVYTPCLCIFGTLGNCLSILVFYTKYHRTHTNLCSSLYLSVLALSDTGFLLSVFIIWLQNLGVDVLNNDFSCPTIMYLGQVTGFLSVWFIVSFTVERFFAVCYPLSPATRFTLSRAKKNVVGLTLFSFIVFSYVFLIARVIPFHSSTNATATGFNTSEEFERKGIVDNTSMSNLSSFNTECETDESAFGQVDFHPQLCESSSAGDSTAETFVESMNYTSTSASYVLRCSVPPEYFNAIQILNYVDTFVTFLIPFLIIAVLNLRIMFCVNRFRRNREAMVPNVKFNGRASLKLGGAIDVGSERRPQLKDYLGPKLQKPRGRGRSFLCRKSHYGSTQGTEDSRTTVNNMIRCCRCQEATRSSSSSCKSESVADSRGTLRHGPVNTGRVSKCTPSPESDEPSPIIVPSAVDSITVLCSRNCTGTQPGQRSVLLAHSSTEVRVTKTLLLVSSVFLVLNFPSHSIRIATYIHVQFSGSEETLDSLFVAQHWANFLFNANFAVNFLLYCYSGRAFRLALKNLLFPEPKTPSRMCQTVTTSATTQVTFNTNMDRTSKRSKHSVRHDRRFSSFSRFAEDQV